MKQFLILMKKKWSFVVMMIFIIIFVGFLFLSFSHKNFENIVEKNVLLLKNNVDLVISHIEDELTNAEVQITNLANLYVEMQFHRPAYTFAEKMARINEVAVFERVVHIDSMGISHREQGYTDLSDRHYFATAIKGQIGNQWVKDSRETGLSTIVFAAPLKNANKIEGILAGHLEQVHLNKLLETEIMGVALDAFLVGPYGRVFAHSKDNINYKEEIFIKDQLAHHGKLTPENEATIQKFIVNKSQSQLTFNLKSAHGESIVYLSRLKKYDWIIMVILPDLLSNEMADQVNLVGRNAGIWLIVFVLLFMAISYLQMHFQEKALEKAVNDATREAQIANNAKSDFLSTVSHDIRTPMNAIIGMTYIAQKNINDTARIQDCLHKIKTSSKHLLGIINSVLDINKIESGKMEVVYQEFNLQTLISEINEITNELLEQKSLYFSINMEKVKHLEVKGDVQKIQQILMNLISNSIKYTPDFGKIDFTIEEKKNAKSTIYEFTVKDNGIGIKPEFLKNLFMPFAREIDSRINKIEGTGLGLTITKKFIDLLGGTIKVQSEVGKGSAFKVAIPLTICEQESFEKTITNSNINHEEIAGKYKNFRTLLVEDNVLNAEIATEILSMAGLHVELAKNGEEALEKFSLAGENYYQIVFMDLQMPLMNGFECTKAIRSLNSLYAKSIPIIAMTANAFAEDVENVKKVGMNEHIAKPIDFKLLYAVLQKHLNA